MADLQCLKKIRSLCILPSILHDDRGFLALFSPMVFLSGRSWPRRALWVSQLCQHWLFIWSSSGTNKCFQPKAERADGLLVITLSEAGFALGSALKSCLAWVFASVIFRETSASDMWQAWKKNVAVWAALRGGITRGRFKGMDAWHPQHVHGVERCSGGVTAWTTQRNLYWCSLCLWHIFWYPCILLVFLGTASLSQLVFQPVIQGFSSSSGNHPNKTWKIWGPGEYESCSWPVPFISNHTGFSAAVF